MRIVAGTLRGRRLQAPRGRRVRPTGDRMKESMFSALGRRCRGARVLDLFAGSGALGFEALSRGASHAVFVDKNRASLDALAENVRALGLEEASTIVRADVSSYLSGLDSELQFNLVFADPPFKSSLAQAVLDWWLDCSRRQGFILVLEHPRAQTPQTTLPADSLASVKSASFGESCYSIYI